MLLGNYVLRERYLYFFWVNYQLLKPHLFKSTQTGMFSQRLAVKLLPLGGSTSCIAVSLLPSAVCGGCGGYFRSVYSSELRTCQKLDRTEVIHSGAVKIFSA